LVKATRSRLRSSATPPPRPLQQGEVFYTHNLGLPELREGARYCSSAWAPRVTDRHGRIAVTSGVSAR
jgi:hypothetical protein